MLTREERVELLKKAREAKAVKKAERDKNKVEPVKGRPKKTDERTLDIVDDVLNEIPTEPIKPKPKPKPEPVIPDDVEVVEKEITEKVKKPKRRILRRIIKQEYESDDTEEEYEEVVVKPKRLPRASIPKQVVQQPEVKEQAEKQATLKHLSNPFFNY